MNAAGTFVVSILGLGPALVVFFTCKYACGKWVESRTFYASFLRGRLGS